MFRSTDHPILFKRNFIGLTVAVFILVAVALSVRVFIDPNDYKAQLEDLVERYTGSELHIDGDIRITFRPYPRPLIEKVRLANAPESNASEMASAESIG